MDYLFIHQNFPGQYVHLVSHLAAKPGNRVYFITQSDREQIAGVEKILYRPELAPRTTCHPYTASYDDAVRTGVAVMSACKSLRSRGIVPDLIVGHSGWGETLLVKDVFPDVPLLVYFEYFYQAHGADVGFDPEFSPAREDDSARLRIRNTVNRMSFEACDWGHTATEWQRSTFPIDMQARITAIHEGIDTDRIRPNPDAWLQLQSGTVLTRRDEVVTYVARNLEPYRGFHCFMRALPEILRRRPRAHIVVVGGDDVSYGSRPPYGGSYREMLLAEVGGELDLSRVHFLGQVPRELYLNVLQISSVHLYLTYPFVLSWSTLEAMAAGCVVVASNTAPALEVVIDNVTGLLVNMFSSNDLAARIESVLQHIDGMSSIRESARALIRHAYDLQVKALPCWEKLFSQLADRRRPSSAPGQNITIPAPPTQNLAVM